MERLKQEYEIIKKSHKDEWEEYNSLNLKEKIEKGTPSSINTKIEKSKLLSKNLYIYGKTGVGKTFWSKEMNEGRPASYHKWYGIINDILTGDEKIKRYSKPTILIIDDFLSKKPTIYNLNLFYEIIDARIENGLQTIITTNYSPVKFKIELEKVAETDEFLKERIWSRMNLFDFYEYKGFDRRKNK